MAVCFLLCKVRTTFYRSALPFSQKWVLPPPHLLLEDESKVSGFIFSRNTTERIFFKALIKEPAALLNSSSHALLSYKIGEIKSYPWEIFQCLQWPLPFYLLLMPQSARMISNTIHSELILPKRFQIPASLCYSHPSSLKYQHWSSLIN